MRKREVAEPSARERLLAAAGELFYREGVQTVGIDRIIAYAGVAKASLYNIFGIAGASYGEPRIFGAQLRYRFGP